MRLADTFRAIVDSLPSDWTDLDLDLRIRDEDRYVEAAVIVAQCNGQPYSRSDWHWRLLVAHEFGHVQANHVWKGIGWLFLFAIPGAYVIARVTRRRGGMANPHAVPLALLTLSVLQLAILPATNAITRRYEREAEALRGKTRNG